MSNHDGAISSEFHPGDKLVKTLEVNKQTKLSIYITNIRAREIGQRVKQLNLSTMSTGIWVFSTHMKTRLLLVISLLGR